MMFVLLGAVLIFMGQVRDEPALRWTLTALGALVIIGGMWFVRFGNG